MTETQSSFFDLEHVDFVAPALPREATIAERYEAFTTNNPWVLPALRRLAQDELAHGVNRLSVKHLTEVLRWQHRRAINRGEEVFAINNSFTSRIARDLMGRYPELAGRFETRELRAQ